MDKVIRISRGLDKALSIIWIVVIALASVGVFALVIVTAVADSVVDAVKGSQGSFTMDMGMVRLWMSSSPDLTAGNLRALALSLAVVGAVCLAIALVAIRWARKILGEMKQGRPFSTDIPAHIRRFAYLIFVCAFLVPAVPLAPAYFMAKLFGLEQIASASPLVERVGLTFNYSPDVLAILIAFFIVLLSFVFDYGAKLQLESDETL